MKMLPIALLLVALPLIVVGVAPDAEGHSWKTSEGRVVQHAHYTEKGVGTSANDDPASGHDAKPGEDHPYKKRYPKAFKDDKLLEKNKKAMEKYFKKKYPLLWDVTIKQTSGATYGANCFGTHLVYPGDPDGGSWVEDIEQVKKVLEDDWELLPAGTKAEPGMILIYRAENKDTGPITHVAMVTKVDAAGNPTEVSSKFGPYAYFDHPPNTVPRSYMHNGGGWKVWRKK